MINEKLLEIQHELKAGKDLKNSFGGYAYRSAEAILEKAKPVLYAHGCTVTLTDDITLIGDRVYLKALATLTDAETGESVSTIGFAREAEAKKGMDVAQITGAASSYARKYALCGLLALDDSKDDPDSKDNRNEGNPPAKKPMAESDLIEKIAKGYGLTALEVIAMIDSATADNAGGDSSNEAVRAKVIETAAAKTSAFVKRYKVN